VVISIHDTGRAFYPEAVQLTDNLNADLDELKTGGSGFILCVELMDEVELPLTQKKAISFAWSNEGINDGSKVTIGWPRCVDTQGRLDALTVPRFEEGLRDHLNQGAAYLVVDLGKSTYISSSGLRALLTARSWLETRAGMLLVASHGCMRSLRWLLYQVFGIYDSVEAAQTAFALRFWTALEEEAAPGVSNVHLEPSAGSGHAPVTAWTTALPHLITVGHSTSTACGPLLFQSRIRCSSNNVHAAATGGLGSKWLVLAALC